MATQTHVRRIAGAALVIAALASPVVAGGAARTRPGGHSGPSASSRPAAGHAQHGSTSSAPQRASGRATYGYSGGYAYGPGYGWGYPWYGGGYYGGYYWDPWWWGWPHASLGIGWYSAPYAINASFVGSHEVASTFPAFIETPVSPAKAEVRLDGEAVGWAKDYNGRWDRLTVAPGRHLIEFSHPGFMTLRIAFDAQGGRSYRFERSLRTGDGVDPSSVELGEPADAPAIGGSHAEGEGERAPVVTAPLPGLQRGFLRLHILPLDAAVYLDGEFLASAREIAALHGAIPVARGPHRLEVVHPERAKRSISVDVMGEEPLRIEVDLNQPE